MYQKFYQQAGSYFQPMGEIFSINMETFDALREKQTALVSSMVAESVEYVKGLSGHESVEAFYSAQKEYVESVQEKLSHNARETMALLNDSQEKIGELIQESVVWNDEKVTQAAAKTATRKKAPARKKTAAKTETKPERIDSPPEPV